MVKSNILIFTLGLLGCGSATDRPDGGTDSTGTKNNSEQSAAQAQNTADSSLAKSEIPADALDELKMISLQQDTFKQGPEDETVGCYFPPLPYFPCGEDSLKKYVSQNLRYPAAAKAKGIKGCVVVVFTIRKDGSIDKKSVKILNSLSVECDREAVRLVRTMPSWIPAESGPCKDIPLEFTAPIRFPPPENGK